MSPQALSSLMCASPHARLFFQYFFWYSCQSIIGGWYRFSHHWYFADILAKKKMIFQILDVCYLRLRANLELADVLFPSWWSRWKFQGSFWKFVKFTIIVYEMVIFSPKLHWTWKAKSKVPKIPLFYFIFLWLDVWLHNSLNIYIVGKGERIDYG